MERTILRRARAAQVVAALCALGILQTGVAASVALKSVGGTFLVPVVINNQITLDFLVDSGASDVVVPFDVFETLKRTGTISDSDLLDATEYTLADGSVERAPRFRIRSLRVGSVELHDVVASVAPIQASLLLGESFLSKFQSWSIDNEHHLLVLNEESTAVQPEAQQTSEVPEQGSPDGASGGDTALPEQHDDKCGAAQTFCRNGMELCGEYRKDLLRDGKYCAGVTDAYPIPAAQAGRPTIPLRPDGQPDYACAAAQNLCRDDVKLCSVYRDEFLRSGHTCPGVTDAWQ